jgi:acetyltransferase-like isoleucine patch superfamily enzyme
MPEPRGAPHEAPKPNTTALTLPTQSTATLRAVPHKPTSVPPAKRPPPPEYVPAAAPPAEAPPAGLRARLRARRAGLRRGVSVASGVALGPKVVFDVAPGATVELGEGCAIGAGCRLHARAGAVTIGAGAVLGERCTLSAHAGIAIGAGAQLGDEVAIVDFDHRYDDVERPVRVQGLVGTPVVIGAGALIGARAAVQRGVTVGESAQVGALSVVTRDVPAGAHVGGVPAQPVSAAPGTGTPCGSRSRGSR